MPYNLNVGVQPRTNNSTMMMIIQSGKMCPVHTYVFLLLLSAQVQPYRLPRTNAWWCPYGYQLCWAETLPTYSMQSCNSEHSRQEYEEEEKEKEGKGCIQGVDNELPGKQMNFQTAQIMV